MMSESRTTWRDSTVYQIYPATFNEHDERRTGIGSIRGITEKLDYLQELGVDAIWVSPFFVSPFQDGGYDIADYTDVDPDLGSLADIEELIREAHERSIKIMIDFIPNHTSDQHRWFQESRQSKDNPKSDWYIWHDGAADADGKPLYDETGNRLPPNNWASVFSLPEQEKRQNGMMPWLGDEDLTPRISSWRWDETRQQFYLASFARFQPDLNWENPEVVNALQETMRFWLDRGVDGFRIDAVNYIAKNPQFDDEETDTSYAEHTGLNPYDQLIRHQSCGYPGNFHERLSMLISVLKEPRYKHRDLRIIFEAYMEEDQLDEINSLDPDYASTFNFGAIDADWSDSNLTARILQLRSHYGNLPRGAVGNQVLGNHDKPRVATRYGLEQARAAAVYSLMLPGNTFIYNGEELGLTDHHEIPEGVRKDPNGFRDPNRTPILWHHAQPNVGFSNAHPEALYLPINPNDRGKEVSKQLHDPRSHLELYRSALALRRLLQPKVFVSRDVEYSPASSRWHEQVAAYGIIGADHRESVVVTNFSDTEHRVTLANFHHGLGKVALSSHAQNPYRHGSQVLFDEGVSVLPYESVVITELR